MIELYKQSKTASKKEHIRLVIVSVGVDVVAKTDDGIYVLNTIKTYDYLFICLFCCAKEGWVVKNIKSNVVITRE